jgi:hypothetical protein
MEQAPWEWVANKDEAVAAGDWAEEAGPLRPDQKAIVCARNAATTNPIKEEFPAFRKNVQTAALSWPVNL